MCFIFLSCEKGDFSHVIIDEDTADTDDVSMHETKVQDTVSVYDFVNADWEGKIAVIGYIIGDCTQKAGMAELEPPFSYPQAILMADSPTEKDMDRVMSVQLTSGTNIRRDLNLVDHPELLGRQVIVIGNKEHYIGFWGIKGIRNDYKLMN
jgi:hypothetical protein